jgi:predicted ATP-dependent serine protease
MLRATKNRFGPVDELGFFAMSAAGLREVRNPSAIFLSRNPQPVPGSLVWWRVTADGRCSSRCRRWSITRASPARGG